MEKVSFTNFILEKLGSLIPQLRSKDYATILEIEKQKTFHPFKGWFIILLLLGFQLTQAQTTVTCNQLLFDDGGAGGQYIEDDSNIPETNIFSVCPENSATQIITLEFKDFSVAEGDLMLAYDSDVVDPDQLVTTVLGGQGFGASSSNAPGGGSITATCSNLSGCITFSFMRNNDGTASKGWAFLAECVAREGYSFPAAGTVEQIITGGSCDEDGLINVEVPIPYYMDCEGNDLIVTTDRPDAIVSFNGDETVLVDAPVGTVTVFFTSPLFPSQVANVVIEIIPIPLACNRDLEVSLSGNCIITLTPDLILEDPCMSLGYEYTISFVDPNRDDLSDMSVVGTTPDGYPIVNFSGVPCGTRLDILVERVIVGANGEGEFPSACVGQIVIQDRVDPVLNGAVDDYVIPCYYETTDFLNRLNALPKNGAGTSIALEPVGVAGMTDMYDLTIVIDPVSAAFSITENCAAEYIVSDWEVIELDCTTDSFDLYGTFDHDNNPNTPEIPIAQDPLWALMAIEVEDPNGTGGKPAVFRCYFRRVKAVDDCGNESNLAIQRICVAQPDIVFPLVEIEIPCGESTDPIDIYNKWASNPDLYANYATFIPVYDPTPLDLNGNFSLFGNLDDTYFTDNSGDEVPVFPDDGACGYAIDWQDSRPIEICANSYKVFREWTVFNFCDGHLEVIDVIPQVLKVGDIGAPTVDFIGVTGIGGLSLDCVSDALIQVDIKDDCSGVVSTYVDFLNDDSVEQQYEFTADGIIVPNLPIGEDLFFTIRVVDECWNSGIYGPFAAQLSDNIPPVAICESFRTVSLGLECEVLVPADVFDDGSYDNCGQVDFMVARMDEIGEDGALFSANFDFLFEGDLSVFGRSVVFTSEDLEDCTGAVQVVFKVTDGSGNMNFCMVEVELQDKIPPVVENTNVMLNCQDTFANQLIAAAFTDNPNFAVQDLLNTSGVFSDANEASYLSLRSDNCDNALMVVDFVDVTDFNSHCKEGTFSIFYQALDVCGNVSFPGIATIEVKRGSNWVMDFPLDAIIYCEDRGGIPGAASIDDIVSNTGCDTWGLEVAENQFDTDGICTKIIREYHLINFCSWNPSNTEVAIVERPVNVILDPYYAVSLRYRDFFTKGIPDSGPDGLNDFDDGDEDGDGDYIYLNPTDRVSRFAPISIPFSDRQLERIADTNEADNYDPYDVTEYDFDADFVVIDYADFPYQNINTYPGLSQFSNTQQHYVSAQDYGNIVYRQIIKINDVTAPIIEILEDGEYCGGGEDPGEGGLCVGTVEVKFKATDLCTADLEVSYELIAFAGTENQLVTSIDPFGALVADGNEYKINGSYPIGKHQVLVTVNDGCSNKTEQIIDFEVVDCKAPTIVCYFGLAADLMANGEVTIWANEFVNHVKDFCSEVELTFADPALYPDSTGRTFRCIDGEVGVVAVNVWATDESGNSSFCETFINIERNPQNGDMVDNCPTAAGASITGAIHTSQTEMVEDVEVAISGNVETISRTSQSGSFYFGGLNMGEDYTITPQKNNDLLNGVSTFDLVRISKHILSIQPFEDPYQIIAADINNSGSITTFDMIALRKVILGLDSRFPNNTSWRFVPSDHKFEDSSNILQSNFPEYMNLNDLQDSYWDMDFVAIKVGDVNATAIANSSFGVEERIAWEDFYLNMEDQLLEKGEIYKIPVSAAVHDILGYQFTMTLDGMELLEIEDGVLTADNFGKFGNLLTVSWNKESEKLDVGERAFTLLVRATENRRLSTAIQINSDKTNAEAYNQFGTPLNIKLNFKSSGYELSQNKPNPFQGETSIGVYLPYAQQASLKVHDLNGKIIKYIIRDFESGYNEIILNSNDLPSGVLYYTFEVADFITTRKMVVFEK